MSLPTVVTETSTLLPTQQAILARLRHVIAVFPVVVLRGDRQSGKRTIVGEYLNEQDLPIQEHSLPYEAMNLPAGQVMTCQDFLRSLNKTLTQPPGVIFFPRIDRVFGVLADYHADNRNLAMLGFEEWLNRATERGNRVIMTAHVWRLDSNISHFQLDLKNTRDDTRVCLERLLPGQPSLTAKLGQVMAIQQPGYIAHCVKHLSLMESNAEDLNTEVDKVTRYRTEMARLTGNTLDLADQVPEPLPLIDLIGLDRQLEQIERAIVRPIEWNHPDVPIKRGIVLYGPPGTGKSSIGRWLAHRLNGKLHLIGGEVGISGSTFIETLDATIKTAAKSSPSVVFIDDVDVIFDQPDSYRALLTMLDGLDNKRRSGICVIVTCMDLARVPSSLLRGGRLEMVLKIDLPTVETITQIITTGFDRI